MINFYFRRKNILYYLSILISVCFFMLIILFVIIDGFLIFSQSFNSIISCLFTAFVIFVTLYFGFMPFLFYKIYNRKYCVCDGKLSFSGKVDFNSVVHGDKSLWFRKQQTQNILVAEIQFCFITEFKYRNGISPVIVEKEKINGKKQIMGYMFLLNKFIYDLNRCEDSYNFDRLNRRGDWKSENYETICSMYYQEKAFSSLIENGFCGEIYLSKAIYEPRKQVFDEIFEKYNVSKEKIHIIP